MSCYAVSDRLPFDAILLRRKKEANKGGGGAGGGGSCGGVGGLTTHEELDVAQVERGGSFLTTSVAPCCSYAPPLLQGGAHMSCVPPQMGHIVTGREGGESKALY